MDRPDHESIRAAELLYSIFVAKRKQAEEDAGELVRRFIYKYVSGIQSMPEMIHPIEYVRYAESKGFLFSELKSSLVHCFVKYYTSLSNQYVVQYGKMLSKTVSTTFQTQWKNILAMSEFYMGRFVRFVKDALDSIATDAMIADRLNSDFITAANKKQPLFLARINMACHMLMLYFCNSLATHMNSVSKTNSQLVDVETGNAFEQSSGMYRLPDNKNHSFVWKKHRGLRIGSIPPSRFKGKEVIIPLTPKNMDPFEYS